MINPNNKTIKITLSKTQINWLETAAKKCNVSKSKFIKHCLANTIAKYLSRLPKEQLELMYKLAKINWLDFEEDD